MHASLNQGRPSNYRPSHTDSWVSLRPVCQICKKHGHSADVCWQRYNPSPFNNMNANFSSFSSQDCVPSDASILGAPSSMDDPLWYPDSGATHHITNSSSVYSDKQHYAGSETVKMGNGKGLCISHIGYASLSSATHSTSLRLNDLLLVPDITKNLLSVSKFSRDNNVFFIFYPHSCYVVHQDTKQVLLQGTLKDGLYTFPGLKASSHYSANSLSFTGNSATINLWLQRFGHCHLKSLQKILSSCNISVKPYLHFCAACARAKCH